jgi:hypothetical protein
VTTISAAPPSSTPAWTAHRRPLAPLRPPRTSRRVPQRQRAPAAAAPPGHRLTQPGQCRPGGAGQRRAPAGAGTRRRRHYRHPAAAHHPPRRTHVSATAERPEQPDPRRASQRRPRRATEDQHRRCLRDTPHSSPVTQQAPVRRSPRGHHRVRRLRPPAAIAAARQSRHLHG